MHYRSTVLSILVAISISSCRQVSQPSEDAGWQYRNSGTTADLIITQVFNSNTVYIGGGNPLSRAGDGVVLKSKDNGSNWQSAGTIPVSSESGQNVYGVAWLTEQHGFAVGDGHSIWSTTNGGTNWTPQTLYTSQNFRCITFASPMVGIAGTADAYSAPPGMNGDLWRTSDGGITWTMITSINIGSFYNIQFSSATNGVVTGKFGAAYYTNDAGLTWTPGTTDAPMYQLTHTTFINAQTGFASALLINYAGAAPDSGRILRTDDGGHSWHTIYTANFGIQGIASNGNNILAAGYNGNVLESHNAGASWSQSSVGSDRWIDVARNSDRWILIGTNGRIATRDDKA
jgi:photosystem II stability/assembly factor-like uncharacterized protein